MIYLIFNSQDDGLTKRCIMGSDVAKHMLIAINRMQVPVCGKLAPAQFFINFQSIKPNLLSLAEIKCYHEIYRFLIGFAKTTAAN